MRADNTNSAKIIEPAVRPEGTRLNYSFETRPDGEEQRDLGTLADQATGDL